jgi:ribonuclease P protein component
LSAFSFKKSDRILKRADFKRLWKTGRKAYGDFFILHYTQNSLGKTRLGVTVSKKVGCAVVRNRIKRLIREYYRKRTPVPSVAYDINVIAKAGVTDLSSEEIHQTLERSFLKISKDCKDEAHPVGAH